MSLQMPTLATILNYMQCLIPNFLEQTARAYYDKVIDDKNDSTMIIKHL